MRSQKINDIKKVLEEAISKEGDGEITVEKFMQALDSKKILRYHREHEVNILSTSGRVLAALIEDQNMTIRAISVYLDLSETMIDKTVKQLINAGLITKTKLNRQNVYRCNNKAILEQPDIRNILDAIKILKHTDSANEPTEQGGDSSPF